MLKEKIKTLFSNSPQSIKRYNLLPLSSTTTHTSVPLIVNKAQRMGRVTLHNKIIIKNKVIFVFFAHKKYSRSFVKLLLNH